MDHGVSTLWHTNPHAKIVYCGGSAGSGADIPEDDGTLLAYQPGVKLQRGPIA